MRSVVVDETALSAGRLPRAEDVQGLKSSVSQTGTHGETDSGGWRVRSVERGLITPQEDWFTSFGFRKRAPDSSLNRRCRAPPHEGRFASAHCLC